MGSIIVPIKLWNRSLIHEDYNKKEVLNYEKKTGKRISECREKSKKKSKQNEMQLLNLTGIINNILFIE